MEKQLLASVSPSLICKEDAAFLAGLFDAEGTFVIGGSVDNVKPMISLYGNDMDLLLHAQKLLGCGNLRSVKRRVRSAAHVESFILDFSNKAARRHVCQIVGPLLLLKEEQCRLVEQAEHTTDRLALRDKIRFLNQKAKKWELEERKPVHPDLTTVDQCDWAYLAGYLEGDGNFSLQEHNSFKKTHGWVYWYAWISVYSTKPASIEYLYQKFGGRVAVRHRKDGWSLEGMLKFDDEGHVNKLLVGLLPFLVSKKKTVEILLDALSVPANERAVFAGLLAEV
jgi:hypothetical protein